MGSGGGSAGWAGLCFSNERWRGHSLPPPIFLSVATNTTFQTAAPISVGLLSRLQKFKTKSPGLPENITALKCRAQNRTDVLFKCQSRHFINHLHGLPHQGSKKGSRSWLSFIAGRPSVKGAPTLWLFLLCRAPSSASTLANCAAPKPRFIRHLCHHVGRRHTTYTPPLKLSLLHDWRQNESCDRLGLGWQDFSKHKLLRNNKKCWGKFRYRCRIPSLSF